MTESDCLLGIQSSSCEAITLILRIKYYSHEPYFPTTSSQFIINEAEKDSNYIITNTLVEYELFLQQGHARDLNPVLQSHKLPCYHLHQTDHNNFLSSQTRSLFNPLTFLHNPLIMNNLTIILIIQFLRMLGPPAGLEPTTSCLQDRHSTIKIKRANCWCFLFRKKTFLIQGQLNVFINHF